MVGGASAAKYCRVGNGPFVICFHVGAPASDSRHHFLPTKLGFYRLLCLRNMTVCLSSGTKWESMYQFRSLHQHSCHCAINYSILVWLRHPHWCMEGLKWLVRQWICKPFNCKPLLEFRRPNNPCAHKHQKSLVGDLSDIGCRGGICENQMDSHISEHLRSEDCDNRDTDPFR